MIQKYGLDLIKPNPWQTRIKAPENGIIKDLALDIAKNGLLQTPIGRQKGQDVELAFGHNRLAAFRWLNDVKDNSNIPGDWSSMPVDIRELSDEQMAILAWSENEKRRDVTPIERARAIERRLADFGWSNRQAAEALGIDHSTISNILRLLKLPEDIQQAIQDGKMAERSATAILVLFDLPALKDYFYPSRGDIVRAALGGASSDHLRELVDRYLQYNCRKLDQAEFEIDQLIPEKGAVYCGLCSTCDKRLANRNLCCVEACFDAKTEFVRGKYLEGASFSSGYSILDAHKQGVPTQLYGDSLEKIKETKCPNLVLEYGEASDPAGKIKGFPKAHLVCEKRNCSCSCLAGLRANEENKRNITPVLASVIPDEAQDDPEAKAEPLALASPLSAKELEEAARQGRKAKKEALERKNDIIGLVVDRLAQDLRNDQIGVFHLLAHQYAIGYHLDDLETSYRKIAHRLAHDFIVPYEAKSKEEMIKIINQKLESFEIVPISLDKTLMEVMGEVEGE